MFSCPVNSDPQREQSYTKAKPNLVELGPSFPADGSLFRVPALCSTQSGQVVLGDAGAHMDGGQDAQP